MEGIIKEGIIKEGIIKEGIIKEEVVGNYSEVIASLRNRRS
ncbi:hypothetical protein [uncultured Bacteroides sp.]|nr:hypothetical protein [uncultured Bacteroides sp.]